MATAQEIESLEIFIESTGELEKSSSTDETERPSDEVDRMLTQVQELARQRDALH